MFALIQNSNVSNNNNDNNNNNNYNNAPGQSSPSRAAQRNDRLTNSAYEAGNSLARLAWLEMDADVEALESSNTASNSLDWSHKPVTPFQHSHTTFPNCPTYTCARCGTTLALQDELISKAFSGRDGKAFLFFSVLNIKVGAKEDRQLLTGLHTVADLNCVTCQRSVGWCYLRAFEASQRYKEGEGAAQALLLVYESLTPSLPSSGPQESSSWKERLCKRPTTGN